MPSSDDRRITRPVPTGPVPTGWELVLEVKRQGGFMLAAQTRADYLMFKERFIALLEVAENDRLAGPYLAQEVQLILDEESRRFRDGWNKG